SAARPRGGPGLLLRDDAGGGAGGPDERARRDHTGVGSRSASRVREGGARVLHLGPSAGAIPRRGRATGRHDLRRSGRQGSRLAQALAESDGRSRNGGGTSEPNACRIRVTPGEDPSAVLAAVRQLCGEHPGRVPVFLHLVLDGQEVVVRARGLSVDGSRELVAEGESRLGPGAVSVDYAG